MVKLTARLFIPRQEGRRPFTHTVTGTFETYPEAMQMFHRFIALAESNTAVEVISLTVKACLERASWDRVQVERLWLAAERETKATKRAEGDAAATA